MPVDKLPMPNFGMMMIMMMILVCWDRRRRAIRRNFRNEATRNRKRSISQRTSPERDWRNGSGNRSRAHDAGGIVAGIHDGHSTTQLALVNGARAGPDNRPIGNVVAIRRRTAQENTIDALQAGLEVEKA